MPIRSPLYGRGIHDPAGGEPEGHGVEQSANPDLPGTGLQIPRLPNRQVKMERLDSVRPWMPSRFFPLIALLCLSPALQAQKEAAPRYQIFGGYSYLSNSLNGVTGSHHALNGFDGSIAFPAWHNLRFKIDTTAYFGTNLGSPQNPYFIMGGGQYTWRLRREAVFVDGLVGTGGANKTWAANTGALGQTASFVSLAGGGLDTRITRRFAFRISGGYQYSYFALDTPKTLVPYRIPGLPINFGHVASGLVWQF
jgi:hypothetical protein